MNHNVKFNPIKQMVHPPKTNISKTFQIIDTHKPNISKIPELDKKQLIQEFKPKLNILG